MFTFMIASFWSDLGMLIEFGVGVGLFFLGCIIVGLFLRKLFNPNNIDFEREERISRIQQHQEDLQEARRRMKP